MFVWFIFQSKDPRFSVSNNRLHLRDLTDEDDGYFSIPLFKNSKFTVATLKIIDCAVVVEQNYASTYKHPIPTRADFLEYTPSNNLKEKKILWNRTNPELAGDSRRYVLNNVWHITLLTQKDNGYYGFRENKKGIVKRLHLKVKEWTKTMLAKEKNKLIVEYPWPAYPWTVTFIPQQHWDSVTTISDGQIVRDAWFYGRIQHTSEGIEITPVSLKDAGTYSFKDPEGNLAMNVQVEVEPSGNERNTFYFVIAAVLIPGLIFCCCCCFWEEKCSKKNKSAQQTATSPAAYHHVENVPAGPGSSAAPSSTSYYQPAVSYVPKAPTEISCDPPAYDSLSTDANFLQPQVYPQEGQSAAPVPPISSNIISSNTEPTFELKGVTFPSAPPLSSDLTSSDVYTSDKLNFL